MIAADPFHEQLYGAWLAVGLNASQGADGAFTFCCPRCAKTLEVANDAALCAACSWSAAGEACDIAKEAAAGVGGDGQRKQPAGSKDIADAFKKSIFPCTRLGDVALPPRARILGDWFMEADLGFVFAPRGLGKTWLIGYTFATSSAFWPLSAAR